MRLLNFVLLGVVRFLPFVPLVAAQPKGDYESSITFRRRHDFCIGPESMSKIHHNTKPSVLDVQIVDTNVIDEQTAFQIKIVPKLGKEQSSSSEISDNSQTLLPFSELNIGPNVTDRDTVLNLAKMTSNAYDLGPLDPAWFNTTDGFNYSCGFGWEGDGLRGHIFSTEDNSSLIVSFKGTTLDPRADTRLKDRFNDILLFSCCGGAQQTYHYAPVCNCSQSLFQCDSKCLTQNLLQNETYYDVALQLMGSLQLQYPSAKFWTIGHSLGGSIASLLGLSFNIPSVTFEAPPERLPARRLGLLPEHFDAAPENRAFTYHFGNTADPIYMGTCNGWRSSCSLTGFDFESQCHSGKRCSYETVRDKGWHMSIANHRIDTVIKEVIEKYDTVPSCETDEVCEDCFSWKFT